MKIRSDRIYTSNGCINGIIEISEGKIVKISSNPTEEVDYDFTGKIIYPGLVDTHNHGNNGYALRNSKRSIEKRYEEVEAYLFNLAAFGVTGVFPTCSYDNVECIETMAHKETDGAKILGIHVEGPWLKRAGEKGKAAKFPDPTREIAEQIVKDAQGTARGQLMEIEQQITIKTKELEDLKKQMDVYKAKMESLLISQLELLKEVNKE